MAVNNIALAPAQEILLTDYITTRFNSIIGSEFKTFYLNGLPLGLLNELFANLVVQDLVLFITETAAGIYLNHPDWQALGNLLQKTAHNWHQQKKYCGWRGEDFTVCSPEGKPLFNLERSAFRPFGFKSHAAHINAWQYRNGTIYHWIAQRSAAKAVAPNKLDNLVGGGVAAGETPRQTVRREAFEEAGLHASLSAEAVFAATCYSCRKVPRGVHREYLHIFNLELPVTFTPKNQDGEVAGFNLMSTDTVIAAIINDEFMSDSVLSILALFKELQLFCADSPLGLKFNTLQVANTA